MGAGGWWGRRGGEEPPPGLGAALTPPLPACLPGESWSGHPRLRSWNGTEAGVSLPPARVPLVPGPPARLLPPPAGGRDPAPRCGKMWSPGEDLKLKAIEVPAPWSHALGTACPPSFWADAPGLPDTGTRGHRDMCSPRVPFPSLFPRGPSTCRVHAGPSFPTPILSQPRPQLRPLCGCCWVTGQWGSISSLCFCGCLTCSRNKF